MRDELSKLTLFIPFHIFQITRTATQKLETFIFFEYYVSEFDQFGVIFRFTINLSVLRVLHLVINVISELKTYEDMLSPWRGECDNDQSPQ